MSSWRWIRADLVYAVHEIQLARHGGLDGIRDKNAVESALARPEQLDAYGNPKPDTADLAAAYAYGFARNHGFSDGNKRTAWVIARVFLADNGLSLQFSEIDAIHTMESVANGSLEEKQLADWFRQRIV
ncbi:death-on-curing protein [Sulfuricella sp. T08]|uniref:type II toxin-antitoxin system death-on-curing family toxin n=1 Tax=Sulfuricella sp. T08 TaxID=1632857 RepID=UPI0006179F68|nr:type II toxin-antitoxin system death-on-curing family toxin [Sulfuricella sp. T08]GAO34636.1 death-on-curing protein [Sulfuricella sp. T08]